MQTGNVATIGGPSGLDRKERKARDVRGRKNRDQQEAVIKISELKDRLDDLVNLHLKAKEAQRKENDAIKATAKASGLLASVVKKAVVARASDDGFDDKKREYEQLALVFEEIKPEGED